MLNIVSRLMIIRLAEREAQFANPELLITIPQNSVGTWDFHKAKDLIELGRRAATEALKN